MRSSLSDWNKNVETIVQWSPFASETELLRQVMLYCSFGIRSSYSFLYFFNFLQISSLGLGFLFVGLVFWMPLYSFILFLSMKSRFFY